MHGNSELPRNPKKSGTYRPSASTHSLPLSEIHLPEKRLFSASACRFQGRLPCFVAWNEQSSPYVSQSRKQVQLPVRKQRGGFLKFDKRGVSSLSSLVFFFPALIPS